MTVLCLHVIYLLIMAYSNDSSIFWTDLRQLAKTIQEKLSIGRRVDFCRNNDGRTVR